MKTNVKLTKTNCKKLYSILLLVVIILSTISGCSMSPWLAARTGCASSSNDPWAHSSCIESADRAYGGPPKDSISETISSEEIYNLTKWLIKEKMPLCKKYQDDSISYFNCMYVGSYSSSKSSLPYWLWFQECGTHIRKEKYTLKNHHIYKLTYEAKNNSNEIKHDSIFSFLPNPHFCEDIFEIGIFSSTKDELILMVPGVSQKKGWEKNSDNSKSLIDSKGSNTLTSKYTNKFKQKKQNCKKFRNNSIVYYNCLVVGDFAYIETSDGLFFPGWLHVCGKLTKQEKYVVTSRKNHSRELAYKLTFDPRINSESDIYNPGLEYDMPNTHFCQDLSKIGIYTSQITYQYIPIDLDQTAEKIQE